MFSQNKNTGYTIHLGPGLPSARITQYGQLEPANPKSSSQLSHTHDTPARAQKADDWRWEIQQKAMAELDLEVPPCWE